MFRLFANSLALAVTSIARNKTRSALTILGIFIGIAAVVAVSALAGAASDSVGAEIDSFATNGVFVRPQPAQASGSRTKLPGRLTEADGRAIQREAPSVTGVAPLLGAATRIVYGDKNVQTSVLASTLEYFPIRKWTIGQGEFWSRSDELLKAKVCVIGATVAEKLFGADDPIGRTVRIGKFPFRVIGTLKARGSGTFGDDQDDRVMMPIGSFRARILHTSFERVDQLMASASSEKTTDRAVSQIDAILRQRHHVESGSVPDFVISTQAEMRKAQERILGALYVLLVVAATISLVVGGVGVMNIMLVSVAERTREIGIRMSIGAREGDIMLQFLVEAIVLTLLGGILGMGAGAGITMGVAKMFQWPMAVSVPSLVLAVGTAVGIGVVFGFFPAFRAAKMDPVHALRVD